MTTPEQFNEMSVEDLAQRQRELETRLQEVCANIVELVAKDVRRYMTRETRQRWLDHPDFAAAMDDASLSRLKAALDEQGEDCVQGLKDDLGGLEAWLVGGEPESRKTLEDNGAVWTSLQKIACKLSGVLSSFGFPPDRDAREGFSYELIYKTPAYFIDREYCPSYIEAYWRAVEEHQLISAALSQTRADEARARLEARWNEVF